MRPILIPALLTLSVLAACGTPQEQCIRRETSELRKVDRLLAEVRANLDRGYALRTETYSVPVREVCEVTRDEEGNVVKKRYCWETETRTRRVPEAIDPLVERRKADGLEAQRAKLTRQAAAAIEACKVAYPE